MTKAIYALSGDPITYGHIDIIDRAAKVFDKVIVAIGHNPNKDYLFNLKQRTELAKKALTTYNNIEVRSFNGMLVDFAYENDVKVIVKGIRSNKDFEYEQTLHLMGASQQLNIDTFLLIARPHLSHVSSSNVKEIQQANGNIHEYVPPNVKQALEAKISNQYIIGVTGEIGAGKTYICNKLIELGQQMDVTVHNIELDEITHEIYDDLTEPMYQIVRETIFKEFGQSIRTKNNKVNRKKLGEIVFNNQEKLNRLNEIMYTPIMVRIGRTLLDKSGIIIINASLIIESNMTYLCNNNIILIKTDKKNQRNRLIKRGLSDQQIKRRLESQYTFKEKEQTMKTKIEKSKQGKLWTINNQDTKGLKQAKQVLKKIIKYFNIH